MGHRLVVFGEVLWDMLPSGKQMGGAPANFAFHANALGADALVCTRVGSDSLGREIQDRFRSAGLNAGDVQVDTILPTGTVKVHLNSAGQPTYEIVENVAWDNIQADPAILARCADADAVYFGSLALRSQNNHRAIQTILERVPGRALRVFDLNLRAPFYTRELIDDMLTRTEVFKLNDDELLVLAEMFKDVLPEPPSEVFDSRKSEPALSPVAREWLLSLARWKGLFNVILTCGSRGSFLLDTIGHVSYCEAEEVSIRDTVGAGDAFTAVCIEGLLRRRKLDEINRAANHYAAYICTQNGAMPRIPEELKNIYG